jgi:hypothetical protein
LLDLLANDVVFINELFALSDVHLRRIRCGQDAVQGRRGILD